MIVIGVDVHNQSLTAVAVNAVGRAIAELSVGGPDERRLVALARSAGSWRARWSRRLLAAGESYATEELSLVRCHSLNG